MIERKLFVVFFSIVFLLSSLWSIQITNCQNLDVANTTYILQNDISSLDNCIEILADSVTLDCQGHSITGKNAMGSNAVLVNSKKNIQIRNCHISNYDVQIHLIDTSNSDILNNTFSSSHNNHVAVLLNSTHKNLCNSNRIENNKLNANFKIGIILHSSSNNVVNNNRLVLINDPVQLNDCSNNIIENNFVISNKNSKNPSGAIDIYYAKNNLITNNTIVSKGNFAVYLSSNSNENRLIGNTVFSSSFGFGAVYSSNNIFSNNFVHNSKNADYLLFSSAKNNFSQNSALNSTYGFYLLNSNNNFFDNNTIYSNESSFIISGNSNHNRLNKNYLYSRDYALHLSNSFYNLVIGNLIQSYNLGIHLLNSPNNKIFDNNINSLNEGALYLDYNSDKTEISKNIISAKKYTLTINSKSNLIEKNILSATDTNAVEILSDDNKLFDNQIKTPNTDIKWSTFSGANNTFIKNNLSGSVWVDCKVNNNYFNSTNMGNIYYLKTGVPSWDIYDIYDTNKNYWADEGSDLSFSAKVLGSYWPNLGQDWHPYTENTNNIVNLPLHSNDSLCFVNCTNQKEQQYCIENNGAWDDCTCTCLLTPLCSKSQYYANATCGIDDCKSSENYGNNWVCNPFKCECQCDPNVICQNPKNYKNKTTCNCECDPDDVNECMYPNVWDEQTCSCIYASCESSSYPACFANCTNENHICDKNFGRYSNTCGCSCPYKNEKNMTINDQISDGKLTIKLVDVSANNARVQIYDSQGNYVGQLFVPLNQDFVITDPRNGESVMVRFSYAHSYGQKWAYMLIYDNCKNRESYDLQNCTCYCSQSAQANCPDEYWDQHECKCNLTPHCSSNQHYIDLTCGIDDCKTSTQYGNNWICDDEKCACVCDPSIICQEPKTYKNKTTCDCQCDPNVICEKPKTYKNPETCECQCDPQLKINCSTPNMWNDSTCTCETQTQIALCSLNQYYSNDTCGLDDCKNSTKYGNNWICDDEKCACVCDPNVICEKPKTYKNPETCECQCDPNVICKNPNAYKNMNTCKCECKSPIVIYDTKPLLTWISNKQSYSIVFEGFDSKLISVTLKNYTDVLDTKSFAENEFITFYSFEDSISMKLLQIQKNNISLISDQCNNWKTYDFDTCQCECDNDTKELCITKGFDWNEDDCSCNKSNSIILCPVIVESIDLLFVSTPTIYGECPKDFECDINTGICSKQIHTQNESRPRLHWWD